MSERMRYFLSVMGVTMTLRGYSIAIEAAQIQIEGLLTNRSVLATKDIYPRLAALHHTKPSNIEHAIRVVAQCCWRNNKTMLCRLTGTSLTKAPSNSELIDMMARYAIGQNHHTD
ncbi:MAG: sporulation initiation factor Spo0A [Blautia sp.]|nr:sporulation initiation factor Spo0A [Blautia sp.]